MHTRRWVATFGLGLCTCFGCDYEPAKVAEKTPPATDVQAQKATAGVGKKGQSLKGEAGIGKIIAGPAMAFISFEQKAVLDIQIPHALQLFQATEGRFPKSHDEFLEKIVTANRLVLPELPEGAVYHFNSEKGELWVYPKDEVPAN